MIYLGARGGGERWKKKPTSQRETYQSNALAASSCQPLPAANCRIITKIGVLQRGGGQQRLQPGPKPFLVAPAAGWSRALFASWVNTRNLPSQSLSPGSELNSSRIIPACCGFLSTRFRDGTWWRRAAAGRIPPAGAPCPSPEETRRVNPARRAVPASGCRAEHGSRASAFGLHLSGALDVGIRLEIIQMLKKKKKISAGCLR